MSNFNEITLVGRMTRDPELSKAGDVDVCKFGVAVNRTFGKDKDTADFFNVVAWRKLAENVAAHKKKGDLVLVSGRVQTGSYEKDGRQVKTFDVVANNVVYLPSKNDNVNAASSNDSNDDIPF